MTRKPIAFIAADPIKVIKTVFVIVVFSRIGRKLLYILNFDMKRGAKMNGYYTYFAFVIVLLAILALKYGWLAVELLNEFNGLVAGL